METLKKKAKGSFAVSQVMLLVLGVIVLAIIAAVYVFLGDRSVEMIKDALHFPTID